MEVLEAIKTRRSIRKYKKDLIPQEKIEKILEAGRWAPSANNSQPWRFIILTDSKLREELASVLTWGKFLAQATLGIAVIVDPKASTQPIEDGAVATYSMLLAAHALGLGGCWIDPSVNEERVKETLSVPKGQKLLSVISLGYPDEAPHKERRELKEITFTNKYGG
jgi:nitroreductase